MERNNAEKATTVIMEHQNRANKVEIDSDTLEKAERAAHIAAMPIEIYIRHLIESDWKQIIGGSLEQLTTAEGMTLTKRTKSVRQFKAWCKTWGITRIGIDLWPTHKIKAAIKKEAKNTQQ